MSSLFCFEVSLVGSDLEVSRKAKGKSYRAARVDKDGIFKLPFLDQVRKDGLRRGRATYVAETDHEDARLRRNGGGADVARRGQRSRSRRRHSCSERSSSRSFRLEFGPLGRARRSHANNCVPGLPRGAWCRALERGTHRGHEWTISEVLKETHTTSFSYVDIFFQFLSRATFLRREG